MTQTMRSFDCSKLENDDTSKAVSEGKTDIGTLLIFRRDVMLVSLMLFFVALPFLGNIWYELGTQLSIGWVYLIGVIAEVVRAFISLYIVAIFFNMLWRIRNITSESKTTLSYLVMQLIAIIGLIFASVFLVFNIYNYNAVDTSTADLLLSSTIPFIGVIIFLMAIYTNMLNEGTAKEHGATYLPMLIILAGVGKILTDRYSDEAPVNIRTTISTSGPKKEECAKAAYVIEKNRFRIESVETAVNIDTNSIELISDSSKEVEVDIHDTNLVAELEVEYLKSPLYDIGEPIQPTNGSLALNIGEQSGSLLIGEKVEDYSTVEH